MADDLNELHERINYNRSEIDEFSRMQNSFFDGAIVQRDQLMGGTFARKIELTAPVPVPLRSKAGCIINDLRTILDALACILAKRNGHTDVGDVYFPISKSKVNFETGGMKKIKKLSDPDKKTIADCLPYAEGDSPLYFLHQADIMRKHQKLTAGVANGSQIRIGSERMTYDEGCVINGCYVDGVYIDALVIGDLVFPDVGKEYDAFIGAPQQLPVILQFGICFVEPQDFRGEGAWRSLVQFGDCVESIVKKFD